jgi:hypothetical protein
MRLVTNKGLTIAAAIKEATHDDELRSLHFTLQLVTSGRSARSRSPRRSPRPARADTPKGKGKTKTDDRKGKGKGKGKGKSGGQWGGGDTAGAHYEAKRTERLNWKSNGKNICARFNRGDCPFGDSCREPHACLRCGDNHPIYRCTKAKNPR